MSMSFEIWEKTHLIPLVSLLKKEKSVVIMRGISGSGKTTLYNSLSKLVECVHVHCSADDYFTSADGTYKFDFSLAKAAHQSCLGRLAAGLKDTTVELIFIDNTNTRIWHFDNVIKMAKDAGVNTVVVEILVQDEFQVGVCLSRQKHHVRPDVLLSQWTKWEHFVPSIVIPMFISDKEKQMKKATPF